LKNLKIILALCLISLNTYSQDEFIDKYENKTSIDKLKILEITHDTFVYKSFRKIYKISLKEIYAYRYKKSNWTFVDSIGKKYGYIYKGKFGVTYRRPEFIMKKYYYGLNTDMIDFEQDYKIVFQLDSTKTRTLKSKRDIGFSLSKDTTRRGIVGYLHKIIQDTLLIKAKYGFDNKVKYWKIPFAEIANINFQTDEQIALKISTGVAFSILTLGIHAGTSSGVQKGNKFNSTSKYQFIKTD
jgi:hypothetical protein